ncbi:MAG: hypothetical protein MH321_18650 [Leptospiraceae bacterium]|nr:hypothetical protein [Leptospiraceae bacterium]
MKNMVYLALIVFLSCGKLFQRVDPDFKDDIVNQDTSFIFNEAILPKIDITREDEIMKMYPFEPNGRISFKIPIRKQIRYKKIQFDRILEYIQYTNKEIDRPNIKGYFGIERVYLRIFLEKGIVREYIVDHIVLEKNNWIKGIYDNTPKNQKELEAWPDSSIDMDCYWLQRKDRNIILRDTSDMHCPYWEAVPAWDR